MSIPLALLVGLSSVPFGVEIDCKSWVGMVRTKLSVTVVTTAGVKNVGRLDFGPKADVEDAQLGIALALEEEGWEVNSGPNSTVLVFAPKGQSVKSIKFESSGWMPTYKFVLAPPKQEKPKPANPGKK